MIISAENIAHFFKHPVLIDERTGAYLKNF